jgi:hypothetical protein
MPEVYNRSNLLYYDLDIHSQLAWVYASHYFVG